MNAKWVAHFLKMAETAAEPSKDTTKVGAILVRDKTILLTAFNGPPAGVEDSPDRFERPQKYLFASHAEQNLVAFSARNGIRAEGCAVVVTHFPCDACARSMIQAGIATVIYGDGKTSMPAEQFEAAMTMFLEAGVSVIRAQSRICDARPEGVD